jgi:fatty acid desaturase
VYRGDITDLWTSNGLGTSFLEQDDRKLPLRLLAAFLAIAAGALLCWQVASRGRSNVELLAITLLAVGALGATGWWLASWLLSAEVVQQASSGRRLQ